MTSSTRFSTWPTFFLLFLSIQSWLVHAQSTVVAPTTTSVVRPTTTTAPIASTTPATTAAATTTYTGVPSLVFQPISTMTACGVGQILWQVYNEDPSKVNITLYAVNEGVDQSIPSASATSTRPTTSTTTTSSTAPAAVSTTVRPTTPLPATTAPATTASAVVSRSLSEKRTILSINSTLVTQYANHGWNFNPVRLPQGRYYIYGYVDDGRGTSAKSQVFSVVEGGDTACLAAFASQSLTASKGASTIPGKTSAASSAGGAGTTAGAGSNNDTKQGGGGISGGAIGGIVVGVILGLGALALLAFFCMRRRRRSQSGEYDYGSDNRSMSLTGAGYGHHRKMPSAATSPSDAGHHGNGKPIALGAIRGEKSYRSENEKDGRRGSSESLGAVESIAPVVMDGDNGRGKRHVSDPFRTPTIPDMPRQPDNAVLPDDNDNAYDVNDFTPVPTSYSNSRPHSYVDTTATRRNSGPLSRTSPPRSGETTPPTVPTPALGRSSSTRRKPVPSLGPELRSEMARQASQNELKSGTGISTSPNLLSGGTEGERRKSYKLVPDPPMIQE
ncbi:hypothetical protein CI109_106024 [Kwoniella shandongensis]|uniref:Uncharacterized protein n=1 Tax=Kwoniella shandongensis TaxID=1734106 RepID=A0A5M6BXS8_9TREE|nr:uncharacterized protein CI109_003927 [Kwoniella shandongensis]KAA5527668.1 hypothetical protein CI109_003927 [Kwoniella shandongensis]